jgi:hypothetical protein
MQPATLLNETLRVMVCALLSLSATAAPQETLPLICRATITTEALQAQQVL